MSSTTVEVLFEGRSGPKAALICNGGSVAGFVWLLPYDPDYATTKYRGAYRDGEALFPIAENSFAAAIASVCGATAIDLPMLEGKWERDVSKFTKDDRKIIFMLSDRAPEDSQSRQSTELGRICPCCCQVIDGESSITWNPATRTLMGRGLTLQLTPTRSRFFDQLWIGMKSGTSPTADQLMYRIYGHAPESRANVTVRAHIAYIRLAIEPFGLAIDGTLWGYRLFDKFKKEAATAAVSR